MYPIVASGCIIENDNNSYLISLYNSIHYFSVFSASHVHHHDQEPYVWKLLVALSLTCCRSLCSKVYLRVELKYASKSCTIMSLVTYSLFLFWSMQYSKLFRHCKTKPWKKGNLTYITLIDISIPSCCRLLLPIMDIWRKRCRTFYHFIEDFSI